MITSSPSVPLFAGHEPLCVSPPFAFLRALRFYPQCFLCLCSFPPQPSPPSLCEKCISRRASARHRPPFSLKLFWPPRGSQRARSRGCTRGDRQLFSLACFAESEERERLKGVILPEKDAFLPVPARWQHPRSLKCAKICLSTFLQWCHVDVGI